eukprot:3590602-Rhodomonas_salina.2
MERWRRAPLRINTCPCCDERTATCQSHIVSHTLSYTEGTCGVVTFLFSDSHTALQLTSLVFDRAAGHILTQTFPWGTSSGEDYGCAGEVCSFSYPQPDMSRSMPPAAKHVLECACFQCFLIDGGADRVSMATAPVPTRTLARTTLTTQCTRGTSAPSAASTRAVTRVRGVQVAS